MKEEIEFSEGFKRLDTYNEDAVEVGPHGSIFENQVQRVVVLAD